MTETASIRGTLEEKRQRYWQVYMMVAPMVFAIICAVAAMKSGDGHFPWAIVAFLTVAEALIGFQITNALYRKRTKAVFLERIGAALGLAYRKGGVFALDDIKAHLLLPQADRAHVEDGFSGTVKGMPLAFEEVMLFERYRDETVRDRSGRPQEQERAIFWGLVVRIGIGKTLDHHTIVMPRSRMGTKMMTMFSRYGRVNLVSPSFEAKFDTVATDQVEARYVLDPAFIERFMEADALAETKWLSASFREKEIVLAFQRFKPMFEIGALWRPLTEKNLAAVLAELATILKMIESLRLNPHTGLGAALPE